MPVELTQEQKDQLFAILRDDPDLRAELAQSLGDWHVVPNTRNRVNRGPLQNLNKRPSETDPRPLFVWSTEAPPDWETHKTYPFPRLLWSVDGVEIVVKTQKQMDEKVAQGYLLANPIQRAETDDERWQREFNALSAEDQAFLLNETERLKRERLTAMAAEMNPEKFAAMTQTTKRGPGRPKKVVNE